MDIDTKEMSEQFRTRGSSSAAIDKIIADRNEIHPKLAPRALFVATLIVGFLLYGITVSVSAASESQAYPDPEHNPQSPVMLTGDWFDHPHDIDFSALPKIPSEHAVVSDVRDAGGTRVNQHNYLAYFNGRFWAMWSDGPGGQRGAPETHRDRVPGHDLAAQRVSFATSEDGLDWSEIGDIAGEPDEGFGWIARGFWVRDGELLALASRFNAPNYRGDGLQLHAFISPEGDPENGWKHHGLVYDNALNNFPPKRLPDGEWMMSRRTSERDVYFLVGGTKAFDSWESFAAVDYDPPQGEIRAEEPYWWVLPDDNTLLALYRDERRSGYLFRSFSTDNGRTWTEPVRTDFPDAKSKFSGVRLSDGRYILVSNPNPRRRNPLALSISEDGMVFTKMGYLVGGRHVDYPHVIEHDGHVYVAFASAKQTVEVLKIDIADLDDLDGKSFGN